MQFERQCLIGLGDSSHLTSVFLQCLRLLLLCGNHLLDELLLLFLHDEQELALHFSQLLAVLTFASCPGHIAVGCCLGSGHLQVEESR